MLSRWHPQLALRYLPIVSYIKKQDIKNPKILEVGSGSLGIGPYLNQNFTGLDIDFSGPQWSKMKPIKGQANKLPFPSNSFDIAISVDVLEHLPPTKRQSAIAELIRIARQSVIIAVPTGIQAQNQDKTLDALYRKKFNQPFPFLTEHLQYGLPSKNQVLAWIKSAAKKYQKEVSINIQPNRNLTLRRWLMLGWMTRSDLVNLFFRKILLLFIPLLQLIDHRPPHYRQIYFIKIR